jgi:outer membrane protein assembly factor BamB
LIKDNLVFVEGYRGKSLVRIDLNGNYVWKCKLPNYVMTEPAVCGSIMVMQIREGPTIAINLTDEKSLWGEYIDEYGSGVCLSDDAYFCFETGIALDPEKTEGWLICRMMNTGEPKWEHVQRGDIWHRPVIDQKSNYVYAVFSEFSEGGEDTRRGGEDEVICFKGDTGDICWRSKLTTAVKRDLSASDNRYWPALRLQNNMLMVLDKNDVLHFFDPKNGNLLFSSDLNPIKQLCSLPNRKVEIINMPLIRKDKLLVFTNYGFVLYPISFVLNR